MQALLDFFVQSGVNALKAREFGEYFEKREFARNEFFLKEGTVSNEYLILENGLLRAFVRDLDGNEVTTAFFGKLQPVFEVSSFFKRRPSKENLQALVPSTGWVITFEK